MKKILMLFVMAATMLSLTSCDDDKIARSLDGIWEGEVSTAYFNYRGNSSQYVDIQFYADPSQYAKGDGIERDYSNTTGTYTECGFRFEVKNSRIYLYYDDGYDVMIRNYELLDGHFSGEFLDRYGNYLASFDLYRVDNWRHYRYNYYIAPDNSTATSEKEATPIKEKADDAE